MLAILLSAAITVGLNERWSGAWLAICRTATREGMKLEAIALPKLHELRGYLEAVSDLVRTGQLKWYFDTKLFEMDVSEFSIQELIKTAYPQSHPDSATITECSESDMLDTLNHRILTMASIRKRGRTSSIAAVRFGWAAVAIREGVCRSRTIPQI